MQVAEEPALGDGAGREEAGLESIVPADGFSRSGHAHELRDRCGNEQCAGVQIDEAIVAIERVHHDAPGGAAHAGSLCCGEDVGTKPSECGRCSSLDASPHNPVRQSRKCKVQREPRLRDVEAREASALICILHFQFCITSPHRSPSSHRPAPCPRLSPCPVHQNGWRRRRCPIRPKVTVSCLFSAERDRDDERG